MLKVLTKSMSKGLSFEVVADCGQTRARLSKLTLKSLSDGSLGRDVTIETPMFMPVGTNATIKGLLPAQVEGTGCQLILANTYHVGSRPGVDTVDRAGGIHELMRWPNALLTDSGGFQMVSLSKLSEVSENGVLFKSPYDKDSTHTVSDEMLLTPEMATQMQHKIGSNIMMQLDDVIKTTHPDEQRMETALHRSIRWYDRCRVTHSKAVADDKTGRHARQNLFPIIQGGLNPEFRRQSAREIVARDPVGIAIGGLSGGEAKDKFIEMVAVSTESLPANKPRYLMGVGLAIDMLMCVAFGVDLFDCVYPTRTARFGCALVGYGKEVSLRSTSMALDFTPLDSECDCNTCVKYTRSYVHHLMRDKNTVGCHLLSEHNIRFQMRFMQKIRDAIRDGVFAEFIADNLRYHFGDRDNYPQWISQAISQLKLDV